MKVSGELTSLEVRPWRAAGRHRRAAFAKRSRVEAKTSPVVAAEIQTTLIIIIAGAMVGGCDTGSRSSGPRGPRAFGPPGAVTPIDSGAAAPTRSGAAGITGVDPVRGSLHGGTNLRILGKGFVPDARVELDSIPGTSVAFVSSEELLCTTPPHTPGLVDVQVILPSGEVSRLNNAYTFDESGPLARVADYGDPTAEEQELLELMNRARRAPPAEGQRLGIDLSGYEPRPPLSNNGFLARAARSHTRDMAFRAFVLHLNPDGVGANGRILDALYDLDRRFGRDRTASLSEVVGAGSTGFDIPQEVHDTLIRDDGNRDLILGKGPLAERTRETGIGYRNLPSPLPFDQFLTQEHATTNRDRPFVLGVVYDDLIGDGIARAGEGRGGVEVTLSHVSGFTLSTRTRSAGGYAFEVFVDEPFTLTIDGQTTSVDVRGDNVKVDLRNGRAEVR